jgi:hypothetical protein
MQTLRPSCFGKFTECEENEYTDNECNLFKVNCIHFSECLERWNNDKK